jgi:hypothetical protein
MHVRCACNAHAASLCYMRRCTCAARAKPTQRCTRTAPRPASRSWADCCVPLPPVCSNALACDMEVADGDATSGKTMDACDTTAGDPARSKLPCSRPPLKRPSCLPRRPSQSACLSVCY